MSYLHPLFADDSFTGQLFEDDRQRIVYVNQLFFKIFSIQEPVDNLIGKNSRELFRQRSQHMIDSEKFMGSIETISHKKAAFTSGKISVTDNQKIEINFTPLISHGKRFGNLWQFRNVSARKELEELLSKSLLQEKKLNELKSQFLSMAVHEFRSPLATILVMADSLEAYWEKMPKQKINQKIKCIKNKVEFLTQVMEKILNLSLGEIGEIKFFPEVLNFNEFLKNTIKEKKIEKPFHFHKIILNTPDHPVFLNIDKQLMKEVIFNILANSIKYSPEKTTIQVEVNTTQSNVIISISDEGKGLPEDETDRIFEPFYRGPNVGKIPGTGLGLALAKQFVELHKGKITFHSKVNEGTTFFITLPKN